MQHLRQTVHPFLKSIIVFFLSLMRFLSKLFFLDLWRDAAARPVLIYAIVIVLSGTLIFHWLEKWNYLDSLYFVIITLTTVGFGDFSPTTTISKIVTIFYGVNGIVILLVLFDLIRRVRGEEMVKKAKKLESTDRPVAQPVAQDIIDNAGNNSQETPDAPPAPKVKKKKKKTSVKAFLKKTMTRLFLIDLLKDRQSRGVLIFTGIVIALGGIAFYYVEKWSLFNSIYFMFTTMTTIGYGDFTPSHNWGKVLTIFFGLNGIVVLLSLYDRIRAVRGQDNKIN